MSKTIWNEIKYWFHSHNIFRETWHQYHNPYYYWWQVRKYVKKPIAHLIKGEYHGYFGLPCRTDSYKGLQFFCKGLGWKSKWDSPRHEWDPIIVFVLTLPWKTWVDSEYGFETRNGEKGYYKRNSYWFGWIFNWVKANDTGTESMATWEMILDMTVWNKQIGEAEMSHHWGSNYNPETKKWEGVTRPFDNLTELGKEKVLEYESNSRNASKDDD